MAAIEKIRARQILDSRGNPTVEVDVWLDDGSLGRAAVPSGASTGTREALERRDGGQAYLGRSVNQVLTSIHEEIYPYIKKKELSQSELDHLLVELDGTANKSRLGANATLGVSLAFAVAQALSQDVAVYKYVGELANNSNFILPRPMFNIMNGGAHANWTTDIQEYMIIPRQDKPYHEHLRQAVEVFHHLGQLLKKDGHSVNVGNEGGYAPALTSNAAAFDYILRAIDAAGYTAGPNGDFVLGIDAAASEFYENGQYHLRRDGSVMSSAEMISWISDLTRQYPLYSIEDALAQDDWQGWHDLTAALGDNHQIVGDDLLVTNVQEIERAITQHSCNSLLVKLNQIGTLTETLSAMQLANTAGWTCVPSHRSGETEDVFLAHLAVGTGAGQIKTGAPSRTDRTAKYNELLRIEEYLEGENA